ncbi:hypothetical protein ACOMHN_007347 [Nucella lapillus]
MREPEGGFLSRVFIGRHEEREDIKTRLAQDGGFLLLHGQPMVGKASLAMQVAEELQNEQENAAVHIYSVDCKDAADWPDVMRAMCRAFSFDETVANENLLAGAIRQRLRENGGGKILLLLLRMHLLSPTGSHLHSLTRCLQTLAAADVMTLMTSRRQLQMSVQKRVLPLTLNDASQLLRHHAPDVTAADFEEVLQHHCHGLPPLVLQMAQLVSGGSLLAFSAEDLREALESEPDLLMRGLGEEARKFFATLSPEVQGHVSTLAQLLDGNFSLEGLQAVVGLEGARMKSVLRRLHDEAPLLIDNESQRICIEPLVLHHVRKLGHVSADDPARLRVVSFLGQVLMRAERELYVTGQDTVYGHLHGDWPQLQHVLKQALHCTHHTYHAYLQVALKADKLLAKCFPHEALVFYQNMAAAAVHFGTARDQAVLQGLIGMAVTLGQAGTGWSEALQYFHRALPLLQQDPRSVSYLRLLIDLGIAYFRLSHLQESDRYLSQAVSVSYHLEAEDDSELIFHLLRARNFLALPCIFRGHLKQSKDLLLETLELCDQLAPHHPDKPILINSLGLVFERSGEDHSKALHYYIQSLVERRRYAAVAPGDQVPTLNNIGMQFSRQGHYGMQFSRQGHYDTALEYLQEAAAIRKKDNRWHYYTALTEQHIGQVFTQMGEYSQAVQHLEEAACVYARCTPSHDVRAKVALCLAHLYITEPLRDIGKTQEYLKQVCDLSESVGDDLSDSGVVVLLIAVQHKVQLDGWDNLPLLHWAQERLSRYDGDAEQIAEHQSIINDIITTLTYDVSEDQKERVTSRVVEQCQICRYLSVNSDVRALWGEMRQRQAAQRAALGRLQGSLALREVLSLSTQHHPARATTSLPLHRSLGKDAFSELRQHFSQPPPGLRAVVKAPFSSQPSSVYFSSTEEEERSKDERDSCGGQLGRVIHRFLEKGAHADRRGACGDQKHPRLSQHRTEDVTSPLQVPSSRADPNNLTRTNFATQTNLVTGKENVGQAETRVLADLVAGEATPHGRHRTESERCSSCSFTSSEPPSTSGSSGEAMSTASLDSTDSTGRRQQDMATFCDRVIEIVAVQETSQEDTNASVSAEPDRGDLFHRNRGGLGGVSSADVPGEASLSDLPQSSPHPHPPGEALSARVQSPLFTSYQPPLPLVLNPLSPQLVPPTHIPSPLLSQAASSFPENLAGSLSHASLPPPQPTLEEVVSCAQQLEKVLPSTATSELRTMLERLSSLTTSESGSAPSQSAAPSETATVNLTLLGDQAAKWSQLYSQHAQGGSQSQNVAQIPAHSSDLQPGTVAGSHSVPRLPAEQRGGQPFMSSPYTPSIISLTAARDQLEALNKMHAKNSQFEAEPNHLYLQPHAMSPGKENQHVLHHTHSDDTHLRQFNTRDTRTLPAMDQYGSARTGSPSAHTPHPVPSTAVTCDRAFPEVGGGGGQEVTASQSSTCDIKGLFAPVLSTGATGTGLTFATIGSTQKTGSVGYRKRSDESGYGIIQTGGDESGYRMQAGSDGRNSRTQSQERDEGKMLETQVQRETFGTQSQGNKEDMLKTQSQDERAAYRLDPTPSVTPPVPSRSSPSSAGLFGGGGGGSSSSGRQPTECDDDSSLSPHTGHPAQGLLPPRSRQATENDERLDCPQHICTSVNCSCSIKQQSRP